MRTLGMAAALAAVALMSAAASAFAADKKYGPGVTDTEIKIGSTMPYSGPASAIAVIGKVQAAYFTKINDEGGVNGRKINLISYDDGFNPAKTMEQTRKLIEGDDVLLTFSQIGLLPNAAIQKYLNSKQVPHLFVMTGATRFGDPKNYPWTIGWYPSYHGEAQLYGQFIRERYPNAKIALFSGNDDAGRDLVSGFKAGLGDKAGMIVAEKTYELQDPTVDSQIVTLKASGADLFMSFGGLRPAVQAIKKVAELGWKPVYFQDGAAAQIASALEYAKGVISAGFVKEPSDPVWKDDPAMKAYVAFMDKYAPGFDKNTSGSVWGYATAQTLVQVLKQCGDDLTRDNVMKQTLSLKDLSFDIFLPGVTINTSPTNYFPVSQEQFMQYDGQSWRPIGSVLRVSSPPSE